MKKACSWKGIRVRTCTKLLNMLHQHPKDVHRSNHPGPPRIGRQVAKSSEFSSRASFTEPEAIKHLELATAMSLFRWMGTAQLPLKMRDICMVSVQISYTYSRSNPMPNH